MCSCCQCHVLVADVDVFLTDVDVSLFMLRVLGLCRCVAVAAVDVFFLPMLMCP